MGEVSGWSPKAGQAWATGKTLPWEKQGWADLDCWEGWQGREGRVWSLQIFASGITQRLSLGTHPAPHAWSGQLSFLRVYYPLTPLCQLLQSPLVSNRALSFRFPSRYCRFSTCLCQPIPFLRIYCFEVFFIPAIKQKTLNKMRLFWKIAGVLTALWLWSTPKLFKYKIIQIQKPVSDSGHS